MGKIRTKVVYHEADLDGVTSGALMLLHKNLQEEDVELIPYDYHKDFNQKLTNGHEVYMIDVSLKVPKMFEVSKAAAEFYLVDHHISFYEDLNNYCTENNIEIRESQFGIAKKIEVPEYNFVYFYATHISGCELTMNLYCTSSIGESAKELVQILGQYDTWRKKDNGKFLPYDHDWDEVVLPIQYSLRAYMDPDKISRILYNLDNGGSKYNKSKLIEQGTAILNYLKVYNKKCLEDYSFSFEHDNVRILAMNTTNFNSFTFDHFWDENLYDAMMSFCFTGNDWKVSMYTTKTETVDILKIAKFFGGGGHKGACGFRIPHNQMLFRKNKLDFGLLTLLDINMLPEKWKGVDVNDILKQLKDTTIVLDDSTIDEPEIKLDVVEKPISEILELSFDQNISSKDSIVTAEEKIEPKEFISEKEPIFPMINKESFDKLMPQGPNEELLNTPIIFGTGGEVPKEEFKFESEELDFKKDEPKNEKDNKADKPKPKSKAAPGKKIKRNNK